MAEGDPHMQEQVSAKEQGVVLWNSGTESHT